MTKHVCLTFDENSCRYWCVKEAFVKAIGTGVGYKLDCIEIHHKGWTSIRVKVNGKDMKDWKFWLFNLGRSHLVSISLSLSPVLWNTEYESWKCLNASWWSPLSFIILWVTFANVNVVWNAFWKFEVVGSRWLLAIVLHFCKTDPKQKKHNSLNVP